MIEISIQQRNRISDSYFAGVAELLEQPNMYNVDVFVRCLQHYRDRTFKNNVFQLVLFHHIQNSQNQFQLKAKVFLVYSSCCYTTKSHRMKDSNLTVLLITYFLRIKKNSSISQRSSILQQDFFGNSPLLLTNPTAHGLAFELKKNSTSILSAFL